MFLFDMQNLPDVNSQLINDLIAEHNTKKEKYKKFDEYYKLKHSILNRSMHDSTKPNNKLIHDFPGYIVDTIRGYFIGKPVTYTAHNSKTDSEYIEVLKQIFRANDVDKKNSELAKQCGIKGEAFEVHYVGEDAQGKAVPRFMYVPQEEMHIVYDTSVEPEIALAMRHYSIYNVSTKMTIEKVELYWTDRIEYWELKGSSAANNPGAKGNNWELVETKEHFYGKVPVVHYKNNEELMGDFERVLTLIDEYDKRVSDNANEHDYFGDAYLKIKGMGGTDGEDLKAAREMRAFFIDGEGADIDFITKDINVDAVEKHIDRIESNVHKFAKVPDISDDQFAGNLSGVAIKFKLWELEQVAIDKELCFKPAMYRRIDLINTVLNTTQTGNYTRDMVDLSFTRNIPANITEIADVVNKLKGVASDETLLEQLPFIDDPAQELTKRQTETTAYNLDDMDFNDQNKNDQNKNNGPRNGTPGESGEE